MYDDFYATCIIPENFDGEQSRVRSQNGVQGLSLQSGARECRLQFWKLDTHLEDLIDGRMS